MNAMNAQQTSTNELLDNLACILEYPTSEIFEHVKIAQSLSAGSGGASKEHIGGVAQFVTSHTVEALEELYTATFDIQAPVHLDVGYMLFGEDYKRGDLLVRFSELHKKYETKLGHELADFLPNVVRLMNLMPLYGERELLAQKLILPAIEKMLEGFSANTENVNPYKLALLALSEIYKFEYHSKNSTSTAKETGHV